MKNLNKGITLIALIITVIVLLILAGVAINMVIGENGLIKKATLATDEYQKASIKEKIQMSIASSYMKENGRKPSLETIKNGLIQEGITVEANCIPTENNLELDIVTNDGFTVAIVSNGNDYDVIVGGKFNGEKKDILPPNPFTPTVISTVNSITISGNTVDAEETIVNLNSGVKAYYFSIDDGVTWVTNSNQLATSYTFSNLNSGKYNLKMKVVDNANNERITETINKGTFASANSTINGQAWSNTNPIIPKDFMPINTDTSSWNSASGPEVTKGLVISDGNSEFVWIPVADINSMVMCQTHGASKTLTVNSTTGEVTCPTCGASTKLAGKLYATTSGDSYNTNLTGQTYTKDSGLREPDNLTDSTYGDSTDNMPSYSSTLYQTEFDKMVKSVAKYKGFYVGRYETSMNGDIAQSKAGVMPIYNINWFRMYESSKTYRTSDANVEACMIWGCQWDEMMKFILDNPLDANHVTATTSVAHDLSVPYKTGGIDYTGSVTYNDKACNIFDLEGNLKEWTQEARSVLHRHARGGHCYNPFPPSYRNNFAPDKVGTIGSRITLYIVV